MNVIRRHGARTIKSGVLTSLVALILCFSAFFAPTARGEETPYRDPTGRIIVREFSKGENNLKQTLIVCSDRPEVEISRLRRFVAYVLADKNYTILDGREKDVVADPEKTSLVYIGHYKQTHKAKECLEKYPELNVFLKEKLTNPKLRDPFPDLEDDNPFKVWHMKRIAPLSCLLLSNRYKEQEKYKNSLFLLFRFLNDSEMIPIQFKICNWDYFNYLFFIEDIYCNSEPEKECWSLIKDFLAFDPKHLKN